MKREKEPVQLDLEDAIAAKRGAMIGEISMWLLMLSLSVFGIYELSQFVLSLAAQL